MHVLSIGALGHLQIYEIHTTCLLEDNAYLVSARKMYIIPTMSSLVVEGLRLFPLWHVKEVRLSLISDSSVSVVLVFLSGFVSAYLSCLLGSGVSLVMVSRCRGGTRALTEA